MTDFSAPILMRMHAHLAASIPSSIIMGFSNVPILGLLDDELARAVQRDLAVDVVLLSCGTDRAEGRDDSVCHDLAEGDGSVMFGDRMFVVHTGQNFVGPEQDLLGEVPLLAVHGDTVVVLYERGVDPGR